VTARYFFVEETAMFKGRSFSGKLFPAGVRLHPFGKCTLLDSSCCRVCEAEHMVNKREAMKKNNFLMLN
jgi:hypothetical protein